MKRSVALILVLFLSGCAIFGDPTDIDETRVWNVQRLHDEAALAMRNKDYDKAIRYYETLQARFPHGRYAINAQLQIAYAYYKKQDAAAAIAVADRFIRLHPHHPSLDYVYYLKGLATFSERGVVERVTRQQISDRDPKALRESFASFKELVTRFPDSKYVPDATQRMGYLVNALAEHEMHVARYYMKRGAYLAAINRCQYVIENYRETPAVEEALVTMVSAYELLGIEDLKQDTLRVLQANFPQSRFSGKDAPGDQRAWWKFWEGLW